MEKVGNGSMTQRPEARQAQDVDGTWEYQAVNRYTGEVVVFGEERPGGHRGSEHVRVYQQAIEALACRRVLGEEAWAVLGMLLGALDWDNWLVVSQRHIAAKLRMTAPQVSRALAVLKSQGIVAQARPPAPRSAYRLQAGLAYRGSRNGWAKRRREEQQEQTARQR